MKKLLLQAVLFAAPFATFWLGMYLNHYLENSLEKWWGFPYILTFGVVQGVVTYHCLRKFNKLWTID